MAQATISHLRHLIRTLNYIVSTHAAEALEDDNLNILDLETIVPTGQIIVIAGVTREGAPAQVVVKIGSTGRLVVITVYLD